MKKSFSLIEVILSVVLLSIVLYSFVNLKNNNLFIFEKIKDNNINNTLINLIAMPSILKENKQKVYFKDFYNIDEDTLRKEIKNIKILKHTEKIEKESIDLNSSLNLNIEIYKTTYSLNNLNKMFYEMKIK